MIGWTDGRSERESDRINVRPSVRRAFTDRKYANKLGRRRRGDGAGMGSCQSSIMHDVARGT